MTFNFAMLDLVDARIAAAQSHTTFMGTMSVRSSATRALVTFDGSSVGVPVKVFSGVTVAPGDRVGLVRFGTDWVVVGAFASVELGTYVDYSSTLVLTGSTGSPTKGTSSYEAQYMWITRHLIRVRVRVDFLAGFVQGTGSLLLSLPVAPTAQAVRSEVGVWWLNDSGVAERGGSVILRDTTYMELFADGGGAPMAFGGTPFDNADNLLVSLEYEPDV